MTNLKKQMALSLLLAVAGAGAAEATIITQMVGWANYDMYGTKMQTGPSSFIDATTVGNTWQDNTNGKYGGRAGTAGDGSSKITYSSLPSGFSSSAGMIEFWFNTDNSWAGLTLLDLGGTKITWNASSHILSANMASGNVLSYNAGDYAGGWHHVALTWAPSGNRRYGTALYWDGVITENRTDFGGVAASYLVLGFNYNTTQYDEVHIYNSSFADAIYNLAGGNVVQPPGYYYTTSLQGVPEPAMGALLLLGGAVVGLRRSRRS